MTASDRLQQTLASLGLHPLPHTQAEAFASYLALLQKWNAKLNLTAIRDESAILRRHFAESIQCARLLPPGIRTLLDFGSGAGIPGIPIAICRSDIAVTLSDSQSKKTAFLQQAVRTLPLPTTAVYSGRVESMPPAQHFNAVTLRAVDHMPEACLAATHRLHPGGYLAILTTQSTLTTLTEDLPTLTWQAPLPLTGADQQILLLGQSPEQ